jgi:hypothetical protein
MDKFDARKIAEELMENLHEWDGVEAQDNIEQALLRVRADTFREAAKMVLKSDCCILALATEFRSRASQVEDK